MALPGASENMTGRVIVAPRGPCVYLAEPEEFTAHPWFGEINMLFVDADGTVVPCCTHPSAGNFGNLNTQKYSEILNGDARRAMKQAMTENRAAMPVCGTCEIGPVGNEGAGYWSAITYWSANKSELP
jgi:radical SAM protein with 4Fe4S-binding SPASM domain